MPTLCELSKTTLVDRVIGNDDVLAIREALASCRNVDLAEVGLLVEIYCDAKSYTKEFEDLFFSTLKEVILRDGDIVPSEQFYLLKMLYSDRKIRPRELQFLRELQQEACHVPAEFTELCKEAFHAHPSHFEA